MVKYFIAFVTHKIQLNKFKQKRKKEKLCTKNSTANHLYFVIINNKAIHILCNNDFNYVFDYIFLDQSTPGYLKFCFKFFLYKTCYSLLILFSLIKFIVLTRKVILAQGHNCLAAAAYKLQIQICT